MGLAQKNIFLTPTQALERMKRYCTYQERSHQEVRHKLIGLGQRGNDLENLMTRLIEEGFLNEERFAIAFAGGKFRMMEWGRKKIAYELKGMGVSEYCIGKALKEIDEADYRQSLKNVLRKKAASIKNEDSFTRTRKLAQYVIGKGYEPELVWQELKDHPDK